ncbi:MAG TPA: alpha/beta hydrolase [Galbitalea sp.]|jgi:pimeloyl-ACP methyl ester carboxylesterase
MPTSAKIIGQSGPAVLLLPGGAEATADFFPGLIEGLLEDPGCRVIAYDRPGTGTSDRPGLLADSATALHNVVQDIGCGPVVVVSQSLGGAVALLWAIRYPQDIAGLVLLEPTPINDTPGCIQLERVMGWSKRLYAVAGIHRIIQAQLLAGMRRSMKGKALRPECSVALDRIGNTDVGKLADAVVGIGQLSRDFRVEAVPRVPTIFVTADRKSDNSIRKSHEELAAGLGVSTMTWSNSAHNVQLDHPDETLAIVRSLIAQTAVAQ